MWEKERERKRESTECSYLHIYSHQLPTTCNAVPSKPKISLLVLYAAGYFYFHMSLIINGQECNKFFNGILLHVFFFFIT